MATVLIVDDEALIRWSLAESLEAAGFSVAEAATAQEALARFGNGAGPVDVVLLDLKLPDSSDLSLLRRIRQIDPACDIILMTAHGTVEVLEEARLAGAYSTLTKPFDVQRVVRLVKSAVA